MHSLKKPLSIEKQWTARSSFREHTIDIYKYVYNLVLLAIGHWITKMSVFVPQCVMYKQYCFKLKISCSLSLSPPSYFRTWIAEQGIFWPSLLLTIQMYEIVNHKVLCCTGTISIMRGGNDEINSSTFHHPLQIDGSG